MPDTDIKKLLLEVDASVEGLRSELRKADIDLERLEKNFDQRLSNIEKTFADTGKGVTGIGKNVDEVNGKVSRFAGSIKKAAVAIVAAGGLQVLSELVKNGIKYAASLNDQAAALGVTTTALQEYRFAASETGVEQRDLEAGLAVLNRNLGEAAAGSEKQIEKFDNLGLSIRDANGEVRNAADLLPDIARALEGVENPAERAARLISIFGKNGQKLDSLLSGGASRVNELRDAAHDLGIVLSEDQIQNADEVADKLDKVKLVLQAKIAGVVADNTEEILALANALGNLAERSIQALDKWLEFRRAFDGQNQLIARAEQYLDNRQDLSPDTRERAKILAREKILDRTSSGSTEYLGGLITVRNPDPSRVPGIRRSGSSQPRSETRLSLPTPVASSPNFSLATPEGRSSVRRFRKSVDALNKPAEEAAQKLAEWNVELDRLSADLALANAQVTGSLAERAEAEKQRIDADLASDILRIKADKELTKAQQDRVIAVQEQIASAKKQLVDQRLDEDLAEERRRADRLLLDQKLNQLDDELRTAEIEVDATRDRRARLVLERRILALQQEEEKARLEAAIAAGEIRDATRARANLEKRQAIERSEVERENLSPGAAYLDAIRKSAGELNDDLERVAVGGLQSLNDGIAEAIVGGDSLGKTFSRIADQIISDLLRIAIQQAIIEPLATGLFGGGAGSSGGGIGGFFQGLAGGLSNLFGSGNSRAIGGPVTAGRPYLVGEKEPEIFVPNANGRIYNPSQIGGGASGGMSVSLTVNAPGATAETVSMIRRELANAAPQIVAAARNATTRELSRKRLT
ncbi:MAG: phage tail tape measure C-terminal domain-containing protein [Parasphingorhabdus sp.]|uniref:phage tail tape measure C-terminal domain-containing protein n=1 Tax=Parasphingorhabdus sp. TaxID=2709688 RepID=UPI0032974A7D